MSLSFQTVFSCFFHGQMLFHAKALELYTAAFQNLYSMDEEQDLEVSSRWCKEFHSKGPLLISLVIMLKLIET